MDDINVVLATHILRSNSKWHTYLDPELNPFPPNLPYDEEKCVEVEVGLAVNCVVVLCPDDGQHPQALHTHTQKGMMIIVMWRASSCAAKLPHGWWRNYTIMV